jgi:hypothetical protein
MMKVIYIDDIPYFTTYLENSSLLKMRLGMLDRKRDKNVNRNVLAITDFSKSSTNAILYASNLFNYSNLKIILLNAYETPDEKAALLISIEDILSKDSETGLKKQSTDISTITNDRNLEISTYSIGAKLKYAIGKIIQSENIDLITAGIPKSKYPSTFLNKNPILFMGQNRYPVLLVPEECSNKPIKNILILNLGSHQVNDYSKNGLEHILNHNHLAKFVINLNDIKNDNTETAFLNKTLTKQKTDLILIVPSTGDRIDRALLNCQVKELNTLLVSLLNG